MNPSSCRKFSQYQFHPADAYTDDGELRVYTQPLDNGASPAGRRRSMVRYAVHGVVPVCLTSCMNPLSDRDESSEMHTAVVISQHRDGSCDVRLLNDVSTIVRGVNRLLRSRHGDPPPATGTTRGATNASPTLPMRSVAAPRLNLPSLVVSVDRKDLAGCRAEAR